jgi:hypothetical protein
VERSHIRQTSGHCQKILCVVQKILCVVQKILRLVKKIENSYRIFEIYNKQRAIWHVASKVMKPIAENMASHAQDNEVRQFEFFY